MAGLFAKIGRSSSRFLVATLGPLFGSGFLRAAAGIIAGATLFAAAAGTAQSAGDAQPIAVLFAVGDIIECEAPYEESAPKTARLIADEIAALDDSLPVRVLLLGDLAYPNGTHKDFECFADKWEGIVRSALDNPDEEILPVPGNHEYPKFERTARGFFEHYAGNAAIMSAKQHVGAEAAANGNYGFFSTRVPDDAGGWLLVGLNSELPGKSAGSPQYRWLKDLLKSDHGQEARCVLAFWHDPVFSSGHHGHRRGDPRKLPVRRDAMIHSYRLLYSSGASVILSGHDHHYEQFKPHNPEGQLAEDGLRSFVVGTGGHYVLDKDWTRWKDIADGPMEKKVYGVLRLDLRPNGYNWKFIAIDGKPKRTGTGSCNPRKRIN